MTNYDLSEEARKKLMGVATPTIATALFKRGLRNQFIQMCDRCRPRRRIWSGKPSRCATYRPAKT